MFPAYFRTQNLINTYLLPNTGNCVYNRVNFPLSDSVRASLGGYDEIQVFQMLDTDRTDQHERYGGYRWVPSGGGSGAIGGA